MTTSAASAGDLILTSSPKNVDIYVRNSTQSDAVKIGSTPFKEDLEDVKRKFSLGPTFLLEFTKGGFESFSMLVAPISDSNLEFKTILKESKKQELIKEFDNSVQNLFEVQRLVRDKNYGDAMKILDGMDGVATDLSIVYEMRCAIHYLKKEFKLALSNYKKAFSLNSDNKDAYNMKSYLEDVMKVSDVE